MLMSNNKLPYPPMIKLEIEIERDSMPAAISSHVWFAVVGTAEESKFKLRPKPRQGIIIFFKMKYGTTFVSKLIFSMLCRRKATNPFSR